MKKTTHKFHLESFRNKNIVRIVHAFSVQTITFYKMGLYLRESEETFHIIN